MHLPLSKKAILKPKESFIFNQPKTIITISVGQPNHEGDKFYSTILAVSKQFSFARIMVCDSLQRHTMQITSYSSPEDLLHVAIRLGDEWLDRNMQYIQQISIPYEISRWNQWINHPDFESKLTCIEELYENDATFRNSIYTTTHGFISRNPERLRVETEKAYVLSKNYLLEECAVMLILADEGYEFEIYPNERNDALDYIHQTMIAKENNQLMRAVSIKFKNINYTEHTI